MLIGRAIFGDLICTPAAESQLGLEGNQIGDEGARALAAALTQNRSTLIGTRDPGKSPKKDILRGCVVHFWHRHLDFRMALISALACSRTMIPVLLAVGARAFAAAMPYYTTLSESPSSFARSSPPYRHLQLDFSGANSRMSPEGVQLLIQATTDRVDVRPPALLCRPLPLGISM
ncbi:hypothetical protein PAPYR_8995 [Paratrimastix pyriformis]|uniref:Uncharacterized protein n=1 Tax=Paratrimastix pyriformis TaxID=342808 RepID=A0ABQ8U9C8_9EUKA|nr:hypothetical protein PAPYR_8995 [Paratrimastix pyriformis]